MDWLVVLTSGSRMTSATNNGFGMATATALGEKAEMQFLNNKLAEYMNRVKQYTNISFRCMYIIIQSCIQSTWLLDYYRGCYGWANVLSFNLRLL